MRRYLLLQINPKYAYDTNKIVATAERKSLLSAPQAKAQSWWGN